MTPALDRWRTLCFEDVEVGDALPELRVPLTRSLIVATAIASRDYQDVHHDPGLAVERGSPDIFMNILTTNGFVGRFVTDWAGPAAVITEVSIRLGAPNYPGDTMVLSGKVEELSSAPGAEDRGDVRVSVRGSNSRGDHVTGTVGLTLPRRRSGERDTLGPRREAERQPEAS
jgi:MaoC like domain